MKKILSFHTRLGWMTAIEQDGKIIELKFIKSKNEGQSLILQRIKKNINDFFSKKTKSFNIPYKIHGTDLQIKIWNELNKIPYGSNDCAKNLCFYHFYRHVNVAGSAIACCKRCQFDLLSGTAARLFARDFPAGRFKSEFRDESGIGRCRLTLLWS